MKKTKLVTRRMKLSKKVVAIIMVFSLTFSAVSVSGTDKNNNIRENHAITNSEEKSLTEKQKEQIKKEDAEMIEQIENVKASKKNSDKRTVVKELKKYRTENSNTYLLSDGSKKVEIFGEDIRFKEDGKYVEYDPSLKEIAKEDEQELASVAEEVRGNTGNNYEYVNVAGDSKQYFPEELDKDSYVILAKNKYLIAFAPINLEEIQENYNECDKKEMAKEEKVEEKCEEKETQRIQEEEYNRETEFQEDVTEEKTVNKFEGLEQNDEQEEMQEKASLKLKDNAISKNKVSYVNTNEDIAYQYTSLKNGIKEEIVLESSPEVNCFDFKMNLSGVEIVENEYSKEIQLVDKKTKKLVAVINEPSIKDAEGNILYNEIKYKIRRNKDKEKILSIQIDKEYLQSEKTKYPIVVDPTVWWVNDRLPSVIVSNFPYTQNIVLRHLNTFQIHNKGIIYNPYSVSENMCYIDTSGIDTNNAFIGSAGTFYGSNVEDAYLSITESGNSYQVGSNGFGTFTSGQVEVRTPVSTWSPDTITWNNHTPVGNTVWSQFTCTGVANTNHYVDLTDWAQALADRSIENTGIALKAEEGTGAEFYSSTFNTSHYMSLTIIYENPNVGDKSIYAYEDFNTANGNAKVELSQGNLLYSQKDFEIPTPQLAFGLTRTYNSRFTESTNFGKGWSCEYDARIADYRLKSLTYIDGTGAFYGFGMQQGTNWVCNQNPDFSLEIGENTQTRVIQATNSNPSSTVSFTSYYIITDKDKVKRYFDTDGRLRLIEEANGTFIYIKYQTSINVIDSIYSSQGQKISVQYSYSDGEYFISKATLADGSYFSYEYSNKSLTEVTHKGTDNGEIVYEYEYNSNGQLNKIIDAQDNYYSIEYDGKSVGSVIYPDGERMDVYVNYQPQKTIAYKKDPLGVVLSYKIYEFDTEGKVTKETNDSGNELLFTYEGSLLSSSTEKVEYHVLQNNIVQTIIPSSSNGETNLEEEIQYNDRNNIDTETDSEGNVTEHFYEDSQNPDLETKVRTTDAGGTVTEEIGYQYDIKGNLIKETDYLNFTVTTYTHDSDGNVIEDKEVLVDDESNMNSVGETVISKGLEDSLCTSTYDGTGNELTSSISQGTISQSENNTYDSMGRIDTSTDEKNIVTEYSYDQFGRTNSTTVTIPGKNPEVTSSTYDSNGRVVEQIDKMGREMTYQYDSMGRVISSTLSFGGDSRTISTTYGYVYNLFIITGTGTDKRLAVASVVTEKNTNNEVISKKYYNAQEQLVREENNGICSDYTYDKQGNVFTTYTRGISEINQTTPKLTVTVYDKNGRLTDTIQNPVYRNGSFTVDATDSIVISNIYDESGNLIQEKDAKGKITSYEYNEEGKLTKVTLPDGTDTGNHTLYAYDIQNKDTAGNILSTKDVTTNALGNVSETIYNGAGQVLSVTDYRTIGNTENAIITSYEYDTSGNKVRENHSDGSYIKYFYNEKNLLTSQYEYNKQGVWVKLSCLIYNSDDLVEKVRDYKVSSNVPHTYRHTIYEYDDYRRMTGCSEINAANEPSQAVINENKIQYQYDIEDKIVEIRYPKNSNDKLKGIQLEYNSYKWLENIKGIISENNEEELRTIRNYVYYNNGNVKTIKDYRKFLQGTSEYINKSYSYDVFDRVTSITISDSGNLNTILENHTYTYDKNSNIISEGIINNYPSNQSEKVNETRLYTYDNLNRLKTSKVTNNITQAEKNTAYTYDKVGNCTQKVEDGVTTTNTYNALNQLVQSSEASNGIQNYLMFYGYDGNGNEILEQKMEHVPTISETIQKEYDSNNQLTKVTARTGGTSGPIQYTQENTYNYDGKRISRTENGQTTFFYYQNGVLLYTTDENGNKKCQNIIGPKDNIIATIHYDNGQHAFFYNKDIETNVTNIVNESGNGVVSYQYDDYGTTAKCGDTDFYNEICYTSGVYDELTGLYYLNARYYSPEDQRFMSQDSYRGEQADYATWNLYAYCGENPINYVDPSGHKAKKEWLSTKMGKVSRSRTNELRVCTDGKVSNAMKKSGYYGDLNHGVSNTTSCFGKYVGADKIPYIVVPPSMSSFKYSVGVIINKRNGNYLYCVVGEVGPQMAIGEVSIYAAWKMKGITPPKNDVVKSKHRIGNMSQVGSWEIILFESSAPSSRAFSKGKRYGWKYKKVNGFRKQIKKRGKKCYKGTGKCLND